MRADLARYTPLPLANRAAHERQRFDEVAEHFPAVRADAHDWLANDDVFAALVRGVIHAAIPRRRGHPHALTTAQAREGWAALVAALH